MAKKTTVSSQDYAMALSKANKFDSSALPDNRDGNYAAGQRTKLGLVLLSMFFASLLGIGFGILFLIAGLSFFPKVEPLTEWRLLLLSIFLFLFGILWIYEAGKYLLRSWWPLFVDVSEGKLAIGKGQVKKDYDDQYYRSMWHQLLDWVLGMFFQDDQQYKFNMLSGAHFYLFEERRFIISQKGYNALDEDIAHILYFTPRSNKLVNIEPISR